MNALLHGSRPQGRPGMVRFPVLAPRLATTERRAGPLAMGRFMSGAGAMTDRAPHSQLAPHLGSGHSIALLVTVVVATFRRPDLLERCLQAQATQDLAPECYEVVVVDDGPAASTRAVEVLAIVITSMVIPPMATYWRLVGAIKFRTLFL